MGKEKESVSKQQVSTAAKNQLQNRKREVPKWECGEASCISWPHRASQKLQACTMCLSWTTPDPFYCGWWKAWEGFLLGAMSPGSHFDALRWISGSRYPAEPAGSGLFNHSALIWLSVHSRCQLWHHHHRNLINFSVSSPSSTEEDKKVLLWTGYKQNMLSEALILQWPLYPCGSALSGFLRTFQKSVSIFQSRKSAMCSGALSHAPDEGKIFFT